jgi:hypothetical protein
MVKETLTASVSPKTMDRVEKYAEEEQISRSEATARLLKRSLDLREKEGVHIVSTDGGKTQKQLDAINNKLDEIEDVADGSDELESLASQLRSIMLPLTLSILWIAIEVSVGIPFAPIGTAVTGIPLILWLMSPQLREMYE